MKETVKILGCLFSYNKTLQQTNKFKKHISKIENLLKVWRMRHLTLEVKINVFKSLAISKVNYLPLVILISTLIINLLNTIQKNFLWKSKYPKIKQEILRKNYESGGLKSVNLFSKTVSLQCSWIQKLNDKNFHEWK